MTWIKRAELLMTWKNADVANDLAGDATDAVQNCCCGCWLSDDVAGQPGSVVGCRAKKEHVGVCCASVSVGSPDVCACGRARAFRWSVLRRSFTSGLLSFSPTRWYV